MREYSEKTTKGKFDKLKKIPLFFKSIKHFHHNKMDFKYHAKHAKKKQTNKNNQNTTQV